MAVYMVGLATGSITYGASSTGNFADGIRVWNGFGNDTLEVEASYKATPANAPRTTTWLNTGLGNDTVKLTLDRLVDGAFMLNTQGLYQDVLDLHTDLSPGDEPVPADSIVVRLNGNVLDPSKYFVNYDLNTIGLLFTPAAGDVLTVTITRYSPVVSATGVVTSTNAVVATERFDGPQLTRSDADTVDGSGSSLPLVIFGGQDADAIKGGTGSDIIVGDRGRVLWFDPATITTPWLGGVVLTPAQLLTLQDLATSVAGLGGVGDRADGSDRLVGLVITVDPTVGGPDVLISGTGSDVVLGGAASDSITTDRSSADADIVLGDHGFVDYILRDANPADLDSVWSTDPTLGGDDTIVTGNGADIVLGGAGSDTVDAGNGANVVAGDNAHYSVVIVQISRLRAAAHPTVRDHRPRGRRRRRDHHRQRPRRGARRRRRRRGPRRRRRRHRGRRQRPGPLGGPQHRLPGAQAGRHRQRHRRRGRAVRPGRRRRAGRRHPRRRHRRRHRARPDLRRQRLAGPEHDLRHLHQPALPGAHRHHDVRRRRQRRWSRARPTTTRPGTRRGATS